MENIEGGQLNEKEQRKELTCEADETANETFPRRSERPSVPTEKMLLYQRDEQNKREKKLLTIYEHWKGQVRVYREDLKSDLSDSRLAEMADDIERTVNDMTKAYSEYRERNEPSHVIRRKMDSCESVTKDIMKIISERLAAIDEYDADRERQRLHQLLAYEHAKSIFGTASQSSYQSEASIAAKRIDAVAELAAKEAQYKITQEEIKQKQKIREMEEKHRRELDAQRSELERLQAEKERQAARAKLEIYDKELRVDMDSQLMLQSNGMSVINQSFAQPASELSTGSYHPHVEQYASIPVNNPLQQLHSQIVTPSPPTDVLQLAKAIQDSIAVSRIPVPVPIVFSGDPITYIEWKASFISLVGHKGISPAEKLHLLKRYITGPALKCLEGTF
uniref:eukaryotic translation initiation factor 3 subunit A n=2 Tax=Haplochromini TaxID=319058 RepID=UPI000D318D08|nr:eukaryotic translation initiation factor 3 subunit A-like [Maylandia zebra]